MSPLHKCQRQDPSDPELPAKDFRVQNRRFQSRYSRWKNKGQEKAEKDVTYRLLVIKITASGVEPLYLLFTGLDADSTLI